MPPRVLRPAVATALVALAVAAPAARAAITFEPTTYALGAGSGPDSVALADLDRANGLDVVVAARTAGSVAVLLNDGHGAFGAPLHYPACAGAAGIVAGPINADFAVDVAVRCDAGAVAVLSGTGTGALQAADVQQGMLADHGLTLAQVTPGGPREVVYATDGPDGPELCWSAYAAGDFAPPECGDDPPSPGYTPITGAIAAADLSDPPGSAARDELITGDYNDVGNIVFWGRDPNDSFGSWTHSTRLTGDPNPAEHAGPPAIMTADLQADGDPDVVASHSGSPGGLAVFLWGETGIRQGLGAQYPSLSAVVTGGAGDFDGDELPDVAVADAAGRGMAHHGKHDDELAAGEPFATPGDSTAVDMATGDVTGDGKADIVMSALAGDSVTVLRATGVATKPPVKPPRPAKKGISSIPKRIRVRSRRFAIGKAKNPPATKAVLKLFAQHDVLVAKGTTFVPAGQRVPMKVRLTNRGRKLLKELGELKVRLKVVARGTTGIPSKLTRHLTLRRRPASHPPSA